MSAATAAYTAWATLSGAVRDWLAAADRAAGYVPQVPGGLTRELYPHEIASRCNFAALDQLHNAVGAAIGATLEAWRDTYAEQLVAAADADPDSLLDSLAAGTGPDPVGADEVIAEVLRVLRAGYDLGRWQVQREAFRQGAAPDPGPAPAVELADDDEVEPELRRKAVAAVSAVTGAVVSAARRAVEVVTSRMPTARIVEVIRQAVEQVTAGHEIADGRGLAGGAVGRGRIDGGRDLGTPARLYASELLDRQTCEACFAIDGREYSTLESAEDDYPGGTYIDCYGGPRCRGTIVLVWSDERESTMPGGGGPGEGAG